MKLSILAPTHGAGLRAQANALNASLMGSADVEVIIRDNSGDAAKQEFVSKIKQDNCKVLIVDECGGLKNHRKALEQAQGDFVYVLADDDYASPYAIDTLLAEIKRIGDDQSIVGTTGLFILQENDHSRCVSFNDLNAEGALQRFHGFLSPQRPCSIFQYSPIRRNVLKNVYDYMATLPVYLAYADWFINCLFLMNGRFTFNNRFTYLYSNNNWSDDNISLKNDARYFREAGLDMSGVRLQWLIACLEGYRMFESKYSVNLPSNVRSGLAECWTRKWYSYFSLHTCDRQVDGARFDEQAGKIAQKWRNKGSLNPDEVLSDIAEFYALSSPALAQKYFEFWK